MLIKYNNIEQLQIKKIQKLENNNNEKYKSFNSTKIDSSINNIPSNYFKHLAFKGASENNITGKVVFGESNNNNREFALNSAITLLNSNKQKITNSYLSDISTSSKYGKFGYYLATYKEKNPAYYDLLLNFFADKGIRSSENKFNSFFNEYLISFADLDNKNSSLNFSPYWAKNKTLGDVNFTDLCLKSIGLPKERIQNLNYKEKAQRLNLLKNNEMQIQYDKPSIISNNLYQIFTYVKNKDKYNTGNVSGMLLYAKTDEVFTPNSHYMMSGNKISVKTLDLNISWTDIEYQLNNIAQELKVI